MRFGCCVSPDSVELAAAAGCDFVELPVAAVLPERPEAEFAPVRERLLAAPVKPEAWQLQLPADLRATGPDVSWPRLARYLYTSLRRIAEVGGAVVAFGSGRQREAPAGFPVTDAMDQLTEVLRICGAVAHSRGLMVGVEPLSSSRCNLVNSLPEAVSLARVVDMPEVGVAVHAQEMALEGHSAFDIVDAAEWLTHVRVSGAQAVAQSGDEVWQHDFIQALRMADYDWRVSIEGEWKDSPNEMKAAVESLRRCFDEAEHEAYAGRW